MPFFPLLPNAFPFRIILAKRAPGLLFHSRQHRQTTIGCSLALAPGGKNDDPFLGCKDKLHAQGLWRVHQPQFATSKPCKLMKNSKKRYDDGGLNGFA